MIHLPALKSGPWSNAIWRPTISVDQIRKTIPSIPLGRLVIALLTLTSIYADANKDIRRLRDQLISVTSSDRRNAAQALGRLGRNAEQAIPDLIHALQDQSEDVREAA